MYETELMREILKSQMAQKMIQEISPRYGSAYNFLWLMQVIGDEWDEMLEWAESFEKQVIPQTATWALEWWEKQYNIIPNPTWSIERRRENIIAVINSRGPMNPTKLAKMAAVASGFDARIVENTGKNRFALYISAMPDEVNEDEVKAALKPAKPARLIYDILYEIAVKGTLYIGGITYNQYPNGITLNQLNQV